MAEPSLPAVQTNTATTLSFDKSAIQTALSNLSPPVPYTPEENEPIERSIAALVLYWQSTLTLDGWNRNPDQSLYFERGTFVSVNTKTEVPESSQYQVEQVTLNCSKVTTTGITPNAY